MRTTLVLCLCVLTTGVVPLTQGREVTNEEIRDAIISLVHSYNLLDNKLERHEHRERALGELIKRALQTLQKGQKAYEPMLGTFSRLDERVSQIETMLIAQEEKYNTQTDKLAEGLEAIFKWMTDNTGCNSQQSKEIRNHDIEEMKDKLEKLTENVKQLQTTTETLLGQAETLITSRVSSSDEVVSRLEDKLSHFYITSPGTTPPSTAVVAQNPEFEEKVEKYLDQIATNIAALQQVPEITSKLSDVDKVFLQGLTNETLGAVEDMRLEVLTASDKTFTKTANRIKESTETIDNVISEVLKAQAESVDANDKFYSDFNKSYSAIQDSLNTFKKFDQVLLTTSEYVLGTQRKVEFGVLQVISKLSELVRAQSGELNATLQKRFDDVDSSIINNHLEALQNLSSTMESEISHVWRQIEIMHSEITYSKDALNKLQGQTDSYVNGTLSTMDSMEGKVLQITQRMVDVDSNLNYLMGRLSLVTQEFNMIKVGLGSALDEIRNSFKTVQEKVKDVGPGPHQIPQSDYATDINLLVKLNAAAEEQN